MGWTTDAGYTNGAVLTAATLNTYLRDNELSLRHGNDYYCKLYLSGNPSIPNNTPTAITWDAVQVNVGGIYVPAAPSILTIPATGKYLLLVAVEWRSNPTGLRSVSILRNSGGAASYPLESQGTPGKSNVNGKLVVAMTAGVGQYLQVLVSQVSGAALTLHGGTVDRTRVSMLFLGT